VGVEVVNDPSHTGTLEIGERLIPVNYFSNTLPYSIDIAEFLKYNALYKCKGGNR